MVKVSIPVSVTVVQEGNRMRRPSRRRFSLHTKSKKRHAAIYNIRKLVSQRVVEKKRLAELTTK